jgi:hypothetical protein
MLTARRLLVCVSLAAFAACSEKKTVEPPRPGVIDPQLKAMEAARSVEGTLKAEDEARRHLMDGSEKP